MFPIDEFLTPTFEAGGQAEMAWVHAVPLCISDADARHGEEFLESLERLRPLSRAQRDWAACWRARGAVEEMIRQNQQGHLRFQELLSMTDEMVRELQTNPTLRIRLNPIRVWCRFETRSMLCNDSEHPAEVLIYPRADSIRAAFLEPHAVLRLAPLSRFGSCTLDEWLFEFDRLPVAERPDRGALIGLCRELAATGITALA